MGKKSKQVKGLSALLFQLGLVVAISLSIVAFEWKFESDGITLNSGRITDDFEELLDIPVTSQPPPPPPKIQQIQIFEVPDEEEITEELDIDLDMDISEEEPIVEITVVDSDLEEEYSDEIFTIVEQKATFIGGDEAFYRYIAKNLIYPNQAVRMGISGKVFIQFVVEKDGSITTVEAIKGIGAGCDEEAVRIIKNSPQWLPAKQRGRNVRSRIVIPLIFNIG